MKSLSPAVLGLIALTLPNPCAGAGDDSLLAAALVVAEKVSVPRMAAEKNLTWQGSQLEDLTRLYCKAGRLDQALAMVRGLDTPDRVKAKALGRIAVAALEAGDTKRADELIKELSASEEWTAPAAMASIARALHSAGDPQGALRLAGMVQDPLEQGRLLLEIGGPSALRDALRAGSQIEPESMHVPRGEGSAWEDDYSGRQMFLLEVVRAAAGQGDLDLARKALEALGRVPDRNLFVWRGRALIAIAPGDAPALRKALAEVEAAPTQTMGELRDKVDLMASLAVLLGKDEGAQVLAHAAEVARRAESVPDPEIRASFSTEMLARIARAWTDLGREAEARELLARAAGFADAMPVTRGDPAADKLVAVSEAAKTLPPSELFRLAPLLSSLPASFLKIDLSARLAAQLAGAGRQAEADQLLAEALGALAAKPERWDLSLIHLAVEVPEAGRPAGAGQRKALQTLLQGIGSLPGN